MVLRRAMSEVLIPDNPQKIFKGAERENYSLQLRISAVSFIPVRLSIVSRGNGINHSR